MENTSCSIAALCSFLFPCSLLTLTLWSITTGILARCILKPFVLWWNTETAVTCWSAHFMLLLVSKVIIWIFSNILTPSMGHSAAQKKLSQWFQMLLIEMLTSKETHNRSSSASRSVKAWNHIAHTPRILILKWFERVSGYVTELQDWALHKEEALRAMRLCQARWHGDVGANSGWGLDAQLRWHRERCSLRMGSQCSQVEQLKSKVGLGNLQLEVKTWHWESLVL